MIDASFVWKQKDLRFSSSDLEFRMGFVSQNVGI